MEHDALMVLIWPVATAMLNLALHLLGKSEHPVAKVLARVGTVLVAKK
jgi:hypothetical protein